MDVISKLEGLVKGQPFINDDFMLTNDFARELYHESAEKMPIIDYHCHLVPEMIAREVTVPIYVTDWNFKDLYKMICRGPESEFVDENFVQTEKNALIQEFPIKEDNKDAIIADMFEAFLGALYLDQGYDAADRFLHLAMDAYIVHPDNAEVFKDYKTKLQEYVQTDNRSSLYYELVEETGPSNAPTFTMNVIVDGLIMGTGTGSSKKQAEQNAAKNAFEKMVSI